MHCGKALREGPSAAAVARPRRAREHVKVLVEYRILRVEHELCAPQALGLHIGSQKRYRDVRIALACALSSRAVRPAAAASPGRRNVRFALAVGSLRAACTVASR